MIERYLSYIRSARRYARRTLEIYQEVLEAYVRFAGGEEVPTLSELRSYEVYLLEERQEDPRTVSLHLSVLSGYCRFLMKEGVLAANPVKGVHRPKLSKRLPEFFRKEAMDRYFAETNFLVDDAEAFLTDPYYQSRLNRLIVSLLYGTGMRRSELIALNRSSFDRGRRMLRVCGKGDKMREIPLIFSLSQELSLYLRQVDQMGLSGTGESEPLLLTRQGRRLYPVYVDRCIKHELAGIEGITGRKSPHVLRHSLATELLNEGTDLNAIKELLGHSSLAATQVYTHNSIEKLKNTYINAHPRAKNGGKHGD